MTKGFDVIPTHEDIRKRHFDEVVFAAGMRARVLISPL
jgi:hypothetical protein